MSAAELKNCPFCGSHDISAGEVLGENPVGQKYTQSMCNGCGALGPEAKLKKKEIDYGSVKATEAWNRRPDEQRAPVACARLKVYPGGRRELKALRASVDLPVGNHDLYTAPQPNTDAKDAAL